MQSKVTNTSRNYTDCFCQLLISFVDWAQDKEIFTVVVTDVNSGGLLATMESLPAFLPYSLMAKNREDSWMSIEVRPAAAHAVFIS